LVYYPRKTRLLAAAEHRGLTVMNGLAHLICQAALSFAHFTDVAPAEAAIDKTFRRLYD
jgi:shikimate 5-dehydrogenase